MQIVVAINLAPLQQLNRGQHEPRPREQPRMKFEFQKTNEGFEVNVDNSLKEFFVHKFPQAVPSREKGILVAHDTWRNSEHNQQLMKYLSTVNQASSNTNEDIHIEHLLIDGDSHIFLPVSMINELLDAVPCATLSRRFSAWKVPADCEDQLEKFQWFASE